MAITLIDLDLDLAFENTVEDLIAYNKREFNVDTVVTTPEGPAGGWPVCTVTGTFSDVVRWFGSCLTTGDDESDVEILSAYLASAVIT